MNKFSSVMDKKEKGGSIAGFSSPLNKYFFISKALPIFRANHKQKIISHVDENNQAYSQSEIRRLSAKPMTANDL